MQRLYLIIWLSLLLTIPTLRRYKRYKLSLLNRWKPILVVPKVIRVDSSFPELRDGVKRGTARGRKSIRCVNLKVRGGNRIRLRNDLNGDDNPRVLGKHPRDEILREGPSDSRTKCRDCGRNYHSRGDEEWKKPSAYTRLLRQNWKDNDDENENNGETNALFFRWSSQSGGRRAWSEEGEPNQT